MRACVRGIDNEKIADVYVYNNDSGCLLINQSTIPFHSLATLARVAPFALATLANVRWVLVGSREGGTRAFI